MQNTTDLFAYRHLQEAKRIIDQIDVAAVDRMTQLLADLRDSRGRLFLIGVGGGAGHAGHAVNDFRKICGIESYAPSDNVSELTARANDEVWETTYAGWLKVSRLIRVGYGPFHLGDLPRGLAVEIARKEVEKLERAVAKSATSGARSAPGAAGS